MDLRRGEIRAQALAALMRRIHLEDMADWSHAEALFMRQIQAIETIDQLRATGDPNFFRMSIEGIEGHPAENCISQRGRLFELIGRSESTAWTVPRPPLIDD